MNTNFAVGNRMLRLSDIAQVRRSFADPPQPLFRINGEPGIGLAVAMRDGGDILALGTNVKRVIAELTENLPLGIRSQLVADQAVTVKTAIAEFTASLWQAIAIILAVSFVSLGVRPGLVIALAIPLTLAIVFAVMQLVHIDMQRISLGALIIALALLVDDAMTTTDAMLSRLAQGDDKVQAGTFAFRTYAFAMLTGSLVTIAGFVPVGFAASSAGEYTFSLFAVVAIALIVSWFVAVQHLFLVLSVAPLGLIGVVAALLLSGKPLGFVAILGILALLGMITKNAVILIGQIEAERAQGKDVRLAAIDASSARFRPITLTAVSTVLGMIPIAPTVFWGPMAIAIMGGLLVATILTLVFLPTLYVAWFGGREAAPAAFVPASTDSMP